MLSMRLLSRGNVTQYAATVQRLHTSTILLDSSSSSSDSDKESRKKAKAARHAAVKEEKRTQSRQETTERLNNLLGRMTTKTQSKPLPDLAVPPKNQQKGRPVKKKPYKDQLLGAAKEVATSLGGNVEKTEAELLSKLLAPEAVKTDEQKGEKAKSSTIDKDFISGMSIEREEKPRKSFSSSEDSRAFTSMSRSDRVQAIAKKFQSLTSGPKTRRPFTPRKFDGPAEAGDLYNGERLEIFSATVRAGDKAADLPKLSTWETLQKKELTLAMTHPPGNYFEEMIMWTEQGKLWKFPIDNEQGLEEEQSVHFSEHVFMERHLKDWCPKRGPIRHFMQLVCVGLSKNPYMTVREKQDHIAWYRDYFGTKQDLLKEIGAIEATMPATKQIEA